MAKFKLDYIDIPVLVRVDVSGARGFQLLAGPSFNFNVRARIDQEEPSVDHDIKDDVEQNEIALVLGGGFYGRRLLVEGRYVEGLTNIAKDLDPGEDSERNRSFGIIVGVRFNVR